MATLTRQANSGYELANKPKIKTKDVWWKRRERKQNNDNNNKQTLSEKKEEAGNVSEQCTRHNPLSSDNNTAGSRRSRDYPPHSYIVNERYNPRHKKAIKEKKQSMARTGH